jgi:LPXTG-motif cell wall-anchored protein
MIVMSGFGALSYDYRTILASAKFDRQAAINYNGMNHDKFVKNMVATHIQDPTKDMWVLAFQPAGKSLVASLQANWTSNSGNFADAVAIFQKENGLTVDGKFGQNTASKFAAKTGATLVKSSVTTTGGGKTPAKTEEKSGEVNLLPWYKRIPWYGYAGAGLLVVGGGFILLKKKKSGLGNIDNGIHGCGCGEE